MALLMRCGVCGKWTNRNTPERELGRVCPDCEPFAQQAAILLFDTDGIRPPANSNEIDKLKALDR